MRSRAEPTLYLLLLFSLCHPCLVLSGDDTHTQGKLPINSLLSLTFNKFEFIYMSSDKGINWAKTKRCLLFNCFELAGRSKSRIQRMEKVNWMHVRRKTDHMWPHHYTSRANDRTGDQQTEGEKNWKKKKKNKKSIVGTVQIYKLDWPSVNERLELRRTTKSSSNSENSLTCWSLMCVSSIVSPESFGEKQRDHWKKGHTQKVAITAERADGYWPVYWKKCWTRTMRDDVDFLSVFCYFKFWLLLLSCSCVHITHCFFLFFWLFFLEWMYF